MNLSDWIKTATLITQQKQEAATADTDQLSSMPLSQLAMDDSDPPVMHYGMHVPAATSTPTHMEMDTYTSQQEDTYQVYLRVHYTLLWPHSALKKGLFQKKLKHFGIKYPKVWRNIYKMPNSVEL